ncbi:MAG: glycosyltransferase family 87 protein [Leptospiraceae bacterium]|nr:glycosyltransferase family 87 protein [Leptospiraceae bacterium]
MNSRNYFLLLLLFCSSIVYGYYLKNHSAVFYADFKSFYYAGKLISDSDKNIYNKNDLMNKQNGIENFLPKFQSQFQRDILENSGIQAEFFDPNIVYPYLYPPVLASLMYFFSKTEIETAIIIWKSLSFFLFLFSIYIIYIKSNGSILKSMFLLCLFIPSFIENQENSQINQFISFFILFSFFDEEKNDLLSGSLLAFATLIKMSPALLIIPFILSLRKKFLISFVTTSIVLILVSILIGGMKVWFQFFEFLPNLAKNDMVMVGLVTAEIFGNLSLYSAVFRLMPYQSNLILPMYYIISFLLFSFVVFRFFKEEKEIRLIRMLCRVSYLTVLLSPMTWFAHIVILLPSMYIATNVEINFSWKTKLVFLIQSITILPVYLISRTLLIGTSQDWRYHAIVNSIHTLFLITCLFGISFWKEKRALEQAR